ncbi:MAG TPA: O-antigen ligase family protein [Elusimicrobiota bacterium]|nr:O-antigen ligase family protein [Elusimicrobiota bacterium]HNG44253.1 O-antigen ligase family protein [Elusimicrobiota bacterium]
MNPPPAGGAARWFERGRSGALAALALTIPLSLAGANLFWGLALGCWLGLLVTDPAARRYRSTGIEIPWLIYLAVELVTALWSDRPAHSLGKVKSEILIVVFLLYAQAPGERRRHVGLFLLGAGIAAALGLVQKSLGWTSEGVHGLARLLDTHRGRAQGFYSNPITYAEMLLFAIFLSLSRRREDGAGFPRWPWAVFALSVAAAAASATRAIWLAGPLALAVWAFRRKNGRVALALGAVLLGAAAAGVASPAFRARAASITDARTDSSHLIRKGVWVRSLALIREHPWRGVGIGNLHIAGRDLPWGGAAADSDWTEAHNIYLQMAVERGIPGLLVFLGLLAAYGRLLVKAAAAEPEWDGLLFGFLALCLAGLTESWTHDSEVVLCLYMMLGVAASRARVAPPHGN